MTPTRQPQEPPTEGAVEGFAEYWVRTHYMPLKKIMCRIEKNKVRYRR